VLARAVCRRHMALQAAAGSPQEAGQQPPEASFEDGGPEDDDFKGAKLLWLLTSLACIGLLGMCVSQVCGRSQASTHLRPTTSCSTAIAAFTARAP